MYRTLDPQKTISTLETLNRRIDERFPGSSLLRVGRELQAIAAETRGRIEWISRPHATIRICIAILLASVVAGIWYIIHRVRGGDSAFDVTEFVPMVEAGMNALVLLGAALFFLLTLEVRIKRDRTLKALHELRAISHVIDMHQLTKDPSQLLSNASLRTPSSPARTLTAFQLTRYLDYCTEMLSLIGKLAALYAQSIPDSVVMQAVNDIETLTNGLSRSIWQKIMILDDDLHRAYSSSAEPDGETVTGVFGATGVIGVTGIAGQQPREEV
ncbi:MAG: hypothetical protein JNL58_20275 [Planctomyces sp.]|nr:hypothetical protein [Planctomyces sp.]